MPSLILNTPAKINLGLDVGPRREDGYHAVSSVLQTVTVWDQLRLDEAEDVVLKSYHPDLGTSLNNLAVRAAQLLRQAAGVHCGVAIHLRKRIPIQAGLGGGSSDAAAVLLGCNRLWGLGWDVLRLVELGARLGSDVPFFLYGGTAWVQGRGEVVRPLPPLPSWPVVLARSGPGMPTGTAYAALDRLGSWTHPDAGAVAELCGARPGLRGGRARHRLALLAGNSFEDVVVPAHPQVRQLMDALVDHGAVGCGLCGSGSAVWALAPAVVWARRVAAGLRARGVWAAAARFCSAGIHVPGGAGGAC